MGLLFFVWPVPHTASVRDLLLVLNLALFGYLAWRQGLAREAVRKLFVPILVLAIFTAWMYIVAVFISTETAWSLSEIKSQWWRGLVALLVGACAASAAKDNAAFGRRIWLVLFTVLMLHILYVDFMAAKEWLAQETVERAEGLTGGPDMSSYLTNILFGFLLAEVYYRATHKKKMLSFSHAMLAVMFGFSLFSVFAERTRNAIITLVIMLLVFGALYLLAHRGQLKRSFHIALAGVMSLIVLGGLGLISTARQSSNLSNLVETAQIAWDTKQHKAWQGGDGQSWPRLANGEVVDPSAYQRIAWFKEGMLLVGDHPLGIGFGRNAFGHGLKAKYGKGDGHSHSGLLDMAIGLGIPGALLWITFVASLMLLAHRHFCFGAAPNYAAVLLFFLVLDHGVRLMIDSVQRDHILQQFMFLVGLAAVMMVSGPNQQNLERKTLL